MSYRVKLTLADVSEEFASACYRFGFGCVQTIHSKKVMCVQTPESNNAVHPYLSTLQGDANSFIKNFVACYL